MYTFMDFLEKPVKVLPLYYYASHAHSDKIYLQKEGVVLLSGKRRGKTEVGLAEAGVRYGRLHGRWVEMGILVVKYGNKLCHSSTDISS